MKDTTILTNNGINLQASLELFGDIETYNDTIGDFIVSAADKTNKLKTYMINKDMSNYAIYVHSLKSDAKYFGFTKLADLAYEHEIKSKAGDVYYICETFNNLVASVNEAILIVKEYLSSTPPQQPPVQTTSSPEKYPAYHEKTILVVDDSNIIRNFVNRIFSDSYSVGAAKDGQEAIDIIESNKNNENIVVILLDLNMPKVDGFAVLKYMQENNLLEKIPVSIISGDSSKETIEKAYQYPIVDMLTKPFSEESVKRVVERTLLYKEVL